MARSKTIRIGLSARLFHPRDGAMGIESKTLQVLEQSIAQWVMSRDVLVLMVQAGITVEEITRELEKRHVIDHKVKQERMQ